MAVKDMSTRTPNAALERCLAEAGRLGRGDAAAGVEAQDRAVLLDKVAQAAGPFPTADGDAVYEAYMRQHARVSAREDLVDAASEMSFPASDPPSFMAGTSTAGGPPQNDEDEGEKPNTRVSNPADVKPSRDDVTNPGSSNSPAAAAGKRK